MIIVKSIIKYIVNKSVTIHPDQLSDVYTLLVTQHKVDLCDELFTLAVKVLSEYARYSLLDYVCFQYIKLL